MPLAREMADLGRRRLLLGVTACLLGGEFPGASEAKVVASERALQDLLGESAVLNLPRFRVRRSRRFLIAGDASPRFLEQGAAICEEFADRYSRHFHRLGMPVEWPDDRLLVVALSRRDILARLQGVDADRLPKGHFNIVDNRIYLFDARSERLGRKEDPRTTNLRVLTHELAHLITFNTGLLIPGADVPRCIYEGLAAYCETDRSFERSSIGFANVHYLEALFGKVRTGGWWVPLRRLIDDDVVYAVSEVLPDNRLPYAEGWILVHYHLSQPELRPRFHQYLSALRRRSNAGARISVARRYLGDLERLEVTLRKYARTLTRRSGTSAGGTR